MITVIVNGVNGKMGRNIVQQIKISNEFKIISGVDIINSNDFLFPVYQNIKDILEIPKVIIDFSNPKASLNILEFAKEKNIPMVIATTGFSESEEIIIKKYSKLIPIFKSSNMSYGIYVMNNIIRILTSILENSDIEIIETHHNEKIDAPSGTTILLGNTINEVLGGNMYYEYNRHDKNKKRESNEIGIHSLRGGAEVGSHTVIYFKEFESFKITHKINDRRIFAIGALQAAKFILEKNRGYYTMQDIVLNNNQLKNVYKK